MRKLTRKDAAWLIVLFPLAALLAGSNLFFVAGVITLFLIFGLNLHSGMKPLPPTEEALQAAEAAQNGEITIRPQRFPFGRMALFMYGIVAILLLLVMVYLTELVILAQMGFVFAILLGLLGLFLDEDKQEAWISLGFGFGLISLVFVFRF